MTRKHFQALAYALYQSRPDGHPDGQNRTPAYNQWMMDVENIADACAQSNGQFDRDRFYAACQATSYSPGMHGR